MDKQNSILKSGEKFAKQEADRWATIIAIEGKKPQGGDGEVTVSVTTEHQFEKVSISGEAWFRRVFATGGSSAGLKGEIKF